MVRMRWNCSVNTPRSTTHLARPGEDATGVFEQDKPGEFEGTVLGPPSGPDAVLGEVLGQQAAVHVDLGEDEFELVGVGVVADELRLGDGLEPCLEVGGNEGGDVRVPPVPVRHDVREDPGEGDQLGPGIG